MGRAGGGTELLAGIAGGSKIEADSRFRVCREALAGPCGGGDGASDRGGQLGGVLLPDAQGTDEQHQEDELGGA